MLVWIASYPRSGNHLTMQTLRRVFRINRFATIHSQERWMTSLNRGYEIPSELEGLEGDELLAALRDRPEPFFVKSHRRTDAGDPAPALYVVRDGRDVHVSLAHWTGERGFVFRGQEMGSDTPYPERLESLVQRHTWSRHVHEWRTRSAPTAILRFEDLIEDPGGAIKRSCDELGVQLPEPVGQPMPFSALHARNPDMYRKGKAGSWREEMHPDTQLSFWRVHRAEMEALGYSLDGSPR